MRLLPMYIIFTCITALFTYMFYMNDSTVAVDENYIPYVKPVETQKEQPKSSKAFVYKSDPRSFSQRKNNDIATKEKWDEKTDVMVLVKPNSPAVKPFYIDAYEAIISDYKAWSVPGQIPTDKIRYKNAEVACLAAGKRLCTIEEWQTACRGGRTSQIAFKDPDLLLKNCYIATSKGYDQTDYLEKTDSHPQCSAPGLPIYHMIGNVAEFVKDPKTGQVASLGLTYYDARIKNNVRVLRYACDRVVAPPGRYPAGKFNKGMGFRCCRDAP